MLAASLTSGSCQHVLALFCCCAGIAMDFGSAFGLVMAASVIGMSIQYWVARYLLKDKVRRGGAHTPHCVAAFSTYRAF